MTTPLVFLPDILCDARLFGPQIAELSAEMPVSFMPLDAGERLSDLAADVLAQCPAQVALVGSGLGGLVAMEILRRAPERVGRIALIATSPLQDCPFDTLRYEPWLVAARAGRLAEVVPALFGLTEAQPNSADAEVLALMQDMAERIGVERFVRQVRVLQRRQDQQSVLRRCQCPALVIGGAADPVIAPQRYQTMAGFIPDAELHEIPGAGHVPSLQDPAAVTAALRGWLARPYVLRG
ncbi:alpha/beta hydrolase [Cognatishimia sp. SS12]|uniref:alpha/beta fold hydrolase n=1 Tax=Cognatishimia sp. SS12 TaxID=2979465 RepID=UPI00232F4906|nr:alpha/beta hydrolase [Cognatishimia sp. SS12]MDC0736777.1 alpha/beta hydrolase [Cognatishimia sp. SS12]